MPVEVSLLMLVSTKGTRHLWSDEFNAFITKWEESVPRDGSIGLEPPLPLADWLTDHNEPELATAVSFAAKHGIKFRRYGGREESLWMEGVPNSLHSYEAKRTDYSTIAGCLAALAQRLQQAREELSS